MKKVISLLLASAMIAGLTACGGSGSSSASSEPAAETAEGGEATEGTEAAASGDAVEIKIWQPTDKESVENWWTEKIAAWNSEHPEIQVSKRPSTAPIPMRMTTRWQQPSHPTICPTSCS